jgi:hypothetical protein
VITGRVSRSGGGEGVKGTGIAVDGGIIAVGVNVGEAGINVAVGVVTEGLQAQTLSNRIVETSSLDLLISLTLISIPLTLRFESRSSQLVSLDGSIPSVFPAPPVCRHSHSRRRVPHRRDSHLRRDIH